MMHCLRGQWRLAHQRRTVWIPSLLCGVAFLIYFIYFCPDNPNPVDAIDVFDKNVCTCGLCKPKSLRTPWFEQHFNGSIEPLLVRKDQVLPDHVLKWWLKLQGINNASDIPGVLEQLFKVVPSGNPYEEQYNRPCRSCAVVGNSGNLKGSRHGEKIDAHNIIIRMNGARTSGFEADVGSKTTHHFMYPESAVHLLPGVHLVLVPFKLQDLRWITSALSTGEIKFTYTRVKQYIKADKDKISVFGFGADQKGNWHHYWENNRFAGAFRWTGVHNAEFESKLIAALAQEGRLKFYK
ncbi:CMP-N-acetylneuraminate-beta-galactosamide-alpha-2,3-sialyltransferase 2-like isoform 2-T3 [Leptodactylus fuscus]|uniref:CMP-N-acetylneuraminate-beta-galactosamide- alpha-2,3-sialyltransferase 2-like isoform X2 n=1 Tax=Leptodactylus fuscus TaxID=238119 RepID=UPI003F4EF679